MAAILAQHDARGDPRRPVPGGIGEGIDDEGDADFATTEAGEIDLCRHTLRALEFTREDFAPVNLDGRTPPPSSARSAAAWPRISEAFVAGY